MELEKPTYPSPYEKMEPSVRREKWISYRTYRKKMKEACEMYIQNPIGEMSEEEIAAFADRLTTSATNDLAIRDSPTSETRTLNDCERDLFCSNVKEAINFFNQRTEEYKKIQMYRKLCAANKKMKKTAKRKQCDIIIHII